MHKLIVAVFLAAIAGVTVADAQPYPTRTITLMVPFPAGGPTDTLARVLGESLRGLLGQSVIVENVSGAGGALGTGRVARAAPDGYTLVLGHVQTHVINAAAQSLQYDVVKDFEPVTLVADTPQWLVVRSGFPPTDIKSLIAWLKANPGKTTAGSVGVGGLTDLAAISFQKLTDTRFQLVPYRGGAPMLQDMLGGTIDMTFGQAANYLGPIRAGQIRALGVMSKQRWWAAPDVPTMDEAGVAGLYSSFWHGIWVPKGTPKEIVGRLHSAIVQALADPATRQRFRDIGQEIWPREQQTPEALAAQQKAEIERWWPVIKDAGIKAQ
jgi:tripartite-type tricarboxylate transporter receptor subunit TctC